jgi:hypothetical protein
MLAILPLYRQTPARIQTCQAIDAHYNLWPRSYLRSHKDSSSLSQNGHIVSSRDRGYMLRPPQCRDSDFSTSSAIPTSPQLPQTPTARRSSTTRVAYKRYRRHEQDRRGRAPAPKACSQAQAGSKKHEQGVHVCSQEISAQLLNFNFE